MVKYEDLPDVLTIQELQEYLRLGTSKAYEVAKEIPHFRNGNRRLFLKEKVKEWMMKQSETKLQKRLRAM